MKQSAGRSFDPVDIEVGPDGAVYISSWGRDYGAVMKDGEMANQGRIYRLWPRAFDPAPRKLKTIAELSAAGLIEELKGVLAARRVDAQEELVRRGTSVRRELLAAMKREPGNKRLETWSNGSRRCRTKPLSHITTSPRRHWCRYTNSGRTT